MKRLLSRLVDRVDRVLVGAPEWLRSIYFRGGQIHCPICDRSARKFLSFGAVRKRQNVRCPFCDSWDRHRTAILYLKSQTNLCDGVPKRLLHFAPDKAFADFFRGVPKLDYLSGDIEIDHQNRVAMERIDITEIQYPESSFDCVYCSHVLEHVPDDRKAMSQLFRVLKPGGWALLMVPLKPGITIEDPTLTRGEDRLRYFEQEDHVRIYGEDFAARLEGVGFDVLVEHYAKSLGEDLQRRYALNPEDVVFLAKKPTCEG